VSELHGRREGRVKRGGGKGKGMTGKGKAREKFLQGTHECIIIVLYHISPVPPFHSHKFVLLSHLTRGSGKHCNLTQSAMNHRLNQ